MKRFKQTNGMYSLVFVVMAFLAAGIYFACSADDDFTSNYELETNAARQLSLAAETPSGPTYIGVDTFPVYYQNPKNECNIKVEVQYTLKEGRFERSKLTVKSSIDDYEEEISRCKTANDTVKFEKGIYYCYFTLNVPDYFGNTSVKIELKKQ